MTEGRVFEVVEVAGSSMEPTLRKGDRLITAKVADSLIDVGDVACMEYEGTLVVHRVVGFLALLGRKLLVHRGDGGGGLGKAGFGQKRKAIMTIKPRSGSWNDCEPPELVASALNGLDSLDTDLLAVARSAGTKSMVVHPVKNHNPNPISIWRMLGFLFFGSQPAESVSVGEDSPGEEIPKEPDDEPKPEPGAEDSGD